jgi:glucose-6-phosphate isomerase
LNWSLIFSSSRHYRNNPLRMNSLISQAWAGFTESARANKHSIADLFAADANRCASFTVSAAGLVVDASKQRMDTDTLRAGLALARACGVEQRREAMFAGEPINSTEGRPVLHAALRAQAGDQVGGAADPLLLDQIVAARAGMLAYAEKVRANPAITDVLHLGIGGSDLGPRLAHQALAAHTHGRVRVHFVANIDGHALHTLLPTLPARTTLVSFASKSFTTLETQTNYATVMQWMHAHGVGQAQARAQTVVLTAKPQAARAAGFDAAQILPFWDWVGGRYSVWSSIGLPVAIAYGAAVFEEFLAGARAMDQHFLHAPLQTNAPVLLALLDAFNLNALGLNSRAVIPYHADLARLPAYLQQLEMESNGKAVALDGSALPYVAAPLVWGEPGTDAQHSFFQWLHQDAQVCPVDFIGAIEPSHTYAEHHRLLNANMLAQSAALMHGKTLDEVVRELLTGGMTAAQAQAAAPHRVFSGNRPSTTILLPRLDARHFGALLALYEHKTFCASVLWGNNAFDQWGVELGKVLAKEVRLKMNGASSVQFDPSTEQLLKLVSR